jgi:hypothetical protein
METCILAALQKNHVGNGKGLVMEITNAWELLSVVNTTVISHPILQIIVVFKNLIAAIQVCILHINPNKKNLFQFIFIPVCLLS